MCCVWSRHLHVWFVLTNSREALDSPSYPIVAYLKVESDCMLQLVARLVVLLAALADPLDGYGL